MAGAPLDIDVFNIKNPSEFKQKAFQLFYYQYNHNNVYRSFCDLMQVHPETIKTLEEIPFLPISFFKTHRVTCFDTPPETTFYSSTTTGQIPSKHHVHQLKQYEKSFLNHFQKVYGTPKKYAILALLPSYLERGNSSLVYMAQYLISESNHHRSGFYLNEWGTLHETLLALEKEQQPTLLIGVSFALLDFVEQFQMELKHTIVMETGGMKGRRSEMVRDELHQKLKQGFGIAKIHSEYGMTELFSQAYATENGRFEAPPWMQILVRSTEDPLDFVETGKTGALNIIDLANTESCAFIATQDLGKRLPNNRFEVLGRFDHAEIRGCNLLAL